MNIRVAEPRRFVSVACDETRKGESEMDAPPRGSLIEANCEEYLPTEGRCRRQSLEWCLKAPREELSRESVTREDFDSWCLKAPREKLSHSESQESEPHRGLLLKIHYTS